jgi:hypothetical protein
MIPKISMLICLNNRPSMIPLQLSFIEKLWWRFVPGEIINVRWPVGYTEFDNNGVKVRSADPNDHYRPELERLVGRQGWDWNWGMADRDATDNRLTIKIRRKHAHHATMLALRWA